MVLLRGIGPIHLWGLARRRGSGCDPLSTPGGSDRHAPEGYQRLGIPAAQIRRGDRSGAWCVGTGGPSAEREGGYRRTPSGALVFLYADCEQSEQSELREWLVCPASAGNGDQRSAVKLTEGTREKSTEALHSRREGRHPETASAGQGAGLNTLRRAGAAADGVLPLAEGVL